MLTRTLVLLLFVMVFLGLVMLAARAYATGFKLPSFAVKGVMLGALMVPLFFILSSVAGRGAYGMSPFLYTLVNSITGIAFYLFLGGIILLVITILAKIFQFSVPTIIPTGILIVSFLMGVAGLIQARFITTVNYTVALENLPPELEGKKAILVTDTHFGLVNYAKFSDKVVSAILKRNPEFVMHAGDFYDGPRIDTAPITASWKKLASAIPVFYAPGNHEGYGNYEVFIESIRDSGVTVLDDKMTQYKGLQIAGLTYYEGKEPEEAKAVLEGFPINTTKPSILINHPPTSLPGANEAGISLMVSGHTHNGQFWPNTYLVRQVYGEYFYGHKRFKDMSVITSSGVGTFGPPLRLFNSPELAEITFVKK